MSAQIIYGDIGNATNDALYGAVARVFGPYELVPPIWRSFARLALLTERGFWLAFREEAN